MMYLPLLAALAVLLLDACGTRLPFMKKKSDVAARVGDHKITVAEIDAKIQPELKRIDGEVYEARRSKLDQLIEEALIEDKAKSLGIEADELVKREVDDKAKEPTDEEVKATYEKFKGQLGKFEDVAPRIKELLGNQGKQARRSEFIAGLRKESKVKIALEPPRAKIDISTGIADGPKDAPIVLIEFSDYQCPFCGRSQAAVQQVLEKYDGKVLHVFMDFPLAQIHPNAQPAAVAARCAGEEGKYWDYHKVLFERQKELSAENFKKWAADLGLDKDKFDQCLDSKKHDAVIQESVKAGAAVGVTGTPGFFVNGISIKGAQPFEVFQTTIETELARKQ
jgi:protein-disulfide isomerase